MHQFIKIFLLLSAFWCAAHSYEWYESGNFYQIYPRSFMDSDNDGIGDLQGIKSKLQYLKDIGMDGVWLSPIYKSPNADFGYDISDFRDIHSLFGTLADFDQLVTECNRLDLKLILDFVPNHSSNEHEWFQKSERNESGYEDYYIWRTPQIDEVSNIPVPINNWISIFRYPAWKWSEIRQQMYYHIFLYQQPDLNYRNPKVVQEMKDVLKFWMSKGVSGFRVDAIPHLFEKMNDDGTFPDEPRSYDPNCDMNDHCSLNNIYTHDQPETYDMVYQWRKVLDEFAAENKVGSKVLMLESGARIDLNMIYYGNATIPGAHFPFNFELIKNTNINSTAADYKSAVDLWLDNMPAGHIANWVLGNHDQHRIASRLGVERGDLLNILLQTLPGVAITYQGEELVMTNVHLSWEETVDPAACNTNDPINYEKASRDPARTPFPWDDSKNAGFSNADSTWLPVGDDYKTVNVKAQEAAANSHLKIFKKLTTIRKESMFRLGNYTGILSNNNNVYSYKRQHENEFAVVVLNFGKSQEVVDVSSLFTSIPSKLKVYTSSLESGIADGEILDASKVTASDMSDL
ncbi:maltase A1-like [Chironomus tepperi]|uniref:maltase A1-like n=1 Tax=Chironomus tepperi TaxID=113505 RepID=UPI00391EEE25